MPTHGDRVADQVSVSRRLQLVVKSDTVDIPGGVARGLWVGTAGTANLVINKETRENVPLLQGYNPFEVTRVKIGGTASDIWAL